MHTQIHNLKISNFYANGAFMINNQDLRVDGLSCQSNQDACFETSWFDSEYTAHAIPCENITGDQHYLAERSRRRAYQRLQQCERVEFLDRSGSGKESVFVGQDPTTTTAHWPDRVSLSEGTIYGAGYGTNPLNVAAAPALYSMSAPRRVRRFRMLPSANITATHISGWGLQMADLQNDDVQLSNVQLL